MNIRVKIQGAKLGIILAQDVQLGQRNRFFAQEVERACEQLRASYTLETLTSHPNVAMVRDMFKRVGVDPTKLRPSSEALARRILKGEDFPTINTLVDINNLGSLESGLPFGVYDGTKIKGDVTLRLGNDGESYEAIGREQVSLAGRIVLADGEGPFGSPAADSTRTMVTENTTNIMMVIYSPEAVSDTYLSEVMGRTSGRIVKYAWGTIRINKIVRYSL